MTEEAQSMLGGRSTRRFCCAVLLAGAPWGTLFPATFIPGDANSSGAVNLTDAISIFRYLYLGDSALVSCRAAADVDGNARIDLSDGIWLLGYLFLGGPPPAQGLPSPGCGVESPGDPLGCDSPLPCGGRGLFFVLQKDGSLADANKLKRLQDEVIRGLQELGENDEFGIVFYDAAQSKFPNSGLPARASAAMKAAGTAYVLSMV